MKRYKPLYPRYSFNLLESIIKPESYIKDIEDKLNKFLPTIKNKKYDLKKLCSKLEWHFSKNKIYFFPESSRSNGGELYISRGINNAGTKADRYSSIGIYCNPLLVEIQKSEMFANDFRKWFLFILKHELIHRGQNLAIRDTKLLSQVMVKEFGNEEEYLSDKQEIMARAWEIIELFKLMGHFNKEEIKIRIRKYNTYRGINSTLDSYFKLFTIESDVIKLLYKYMYLYLEEN
jgi:hypothetical protein